MVSSPQRTRHTLLLISPPTLDCTTFALSDLSLVGLFLTQCLHVHNSVLSPLVCTFRERIECVFFQVQFPEAEPENHHADKTDASNSRVAPGEQGIYCKQDKRLRNGTGEGVGEPVQAGHERSHVMGRFREGIFK